MTPPEPTNWTVHLAARRPWRAVAALLLIICGLFALHALGERSALVLGVSALILLAAIAEFLLPISYSLDAAGASVRLLGSRRLFPWGRVRRVYLRRNGIQLSPFAMQNWLENYRGVLLRSSNPPELLAKVRAWLQYAGVTVEIIEER